MDYDQFQTEYLGTFEPSIPAELCEMAQYYYEVTESFDQIVCSARSPKGVAIPATGEERLRIERNAREVLCRLLRAANRSGYSSKDFHNAMRHVSRVIR